MNICISMAATRDVTTSLMAVRIAVLNELPMAFHTDCDLVRSASNTPPACCLSESKICRLCSRTNCVVRLAAFSRAARIAASLASSPWSRISWRCPCQFLDARLDLVGLVLQPGEGQLLLQQHPARVHVVKRLLHLVDLFQIVDLDGGFLLLDRDLLLERLRRPHPRPAGGARRARSPPAVPRRRTPSADDRGSSPRYQRRS